MARAVKISFRAAVFGASTLLALSMSPLGNAHEMHGMQSQQPPSLPISAGEAPFLRGNNAAMTKMMNGMAIKPSGDVDKDFVDMMAPHHQGAIDMAILELQYGHNARLKAIAQEILITQQQEIAAMRLAVGETLPPSVPPLADAAAARPAK